MATTTTTTNKPLNPRAQDLSPKGYNRANIFSGKALDFDGVNDTISIPNSTSLNITGNALTIFGHVNHDGSGAWQSIAYKDTGNNVGYQLFINNSNVFAFGIHTPTGFLRLETSEIISAGRWYTFACTYDGAMMSIYVNGRLSIQTAKTGDITDSSAAPFYVGRNFAGSEVLNARLAGLRVFNTALTPAQVSDLYLNPEKIVPDGVASSALKLWLPMMEGAGTTAYDGSGNGNDGTINGATWTAGIGAPVAQTALVSWDKGTNYLLNSEQITGSGWNSNAVTRTANSTTAPNGTTTADTLADNATDGTHVIFQLAATISGSFVGEAYLKDNGRRYAGVSITTGASSATRYAAFVDLQTGTITQTNTLGSPTGTSSSIASVGNGWHRVRVVMTATTSNDNYIVITTSNTGTPSVFQSPTLDPRYAGDGSSIYVWGASIRPVTAGDAYIKTNATAQTSAVLVPEGLTAGASIFGTDIITPRNAFALNLDGASLASVHDNASVDLTTAATFEAWVNIPSAPSLVDSGIISKYNSSGSFLLSYRASGPQLGFAMYIHGGGSLISSYATDFVPTYGAWVHVVGIYIGGTSITTFVNGAQASQNTSGIPATMTQSALNVQIGKWSNNVSNLRIANPRIYNRALTAAEVLRNYNADKAKFGL